MDVKLHGTITLLFANFTQPSMMVVPQPPALIRLHRFNLHCNNFNNSSKVGYSFHGKLETSTGINDLRNNKIPNHQLPSSSRKPRWQPTAWQDATIQNNRISCHRTVFCKKCEPTHIPTVERRVCEAGEIVCKGNFSFCFNYFPRWHQRQSGRSFVIFPGMCMESGGVNRIGERLEISHQPFVAYFSTVRWRKFIKLKAIN